MSQSPPSSGRFGHPALDKIIKDYHKQGMERDATAAKARGKAPTEPAGAAQLAQLLHAVITRAQTPDDMLYEAMTRQNEEWMAYAKPLPMAGADTGRAANARRARMSPWPLK